MKEIIHTGNFLQLIKQDGWEFVERVRCSGVVIIIGVTNDAKILFVQQHRVPVGKSCIELPAGLAGDNKTETNEEAVTRELAEEAGYEAKRVRYLGNGVVTPGLTSEDAAMYLATGLVKIPNPPKDESENIILHEIPLANADEWLAQKRGEGLVIDWKCYAALHFAATYGCPDTTAEIEEHHEETRLPG